MLICCLFLVVVWLLLLWVVVVVAVLGLAVLPATALAVVVTMVAAYIPMQLHILLVNISGGHSFPCGWMRAG